MNVIEFLYRCDGNYRIVTSADLTISQANKAREEGRMFIDPDTGLTWALLPWEVSTVKDRKREKEESSNKFNP